MGFAIDTLAYARRLREAGFTEQQAEGQATALAAAMTDTLATKQDLRELEARIDARFVGVDARFASVDARFAAVDARFDAVDVRFDAVDARFDEQGRRMLLLFQEQGSRFDAKLADLERRMTMRLGGITVACFGAFSALTKVL